MGDEHHPGDPQELSDQELTEHIASLEHERALAKAELRRRHTAALLGTPEQRRKHFRVIRGSGVVAGLVALTDWFRHHRYATALVAASITAIAAMPFVVDGENDARIAAPVLQLPEATGNHPPRYHYLPPPIIVDVETDSPTEEPENDEPAGTNATIDEISSVEPSLVAAGDQGGDQSTGPVPSTPEPTVVEPVVDEPEPPVEEPEPPTKEPEPEPEPEEPKPPEPPKDNDDPRDCTVEVDLRPLLSVCVTLGVLNQ